MSDFTDLSVAVGKLEIQVKKLEDDMTELKGDIKFIRQKLDQAAGGWKVFMMVGGAGAALGAFLLKLVDVVISK